MICADGHDVIRRCLINEVVQPVGKQQIGMASPAHHRLLGIVVIAEIVLGKIDGQAQVLIPEILVFQGILVVFGMAGNEDLPALPAGNGIHPRLRGRCQDPQAVYLLYILPPHRGMAGMGDPEPIVKPTQQNGPAVLHFMLEHTE